MCPQFASSNGFYSFIAVPIYIILREFGIRGVWKNGKNKSATEIVADLFGEFTDF